MSIGYKIKKLREEKKHLTQEQLASILGVSQSELSKIENGETKKIDFLLITKACEYFDKDFEFFMSNHLQTNNIKKLDGCINNHGTININPENIINEIKNLFAENESLRTENELLKSKK